VHLFCGSLGALRFFFYDLNPATALLLCMTHEMSFGMTLSRVFVLSAEQQSPHAETDTGIPVMRDARAMTSLVNVELFGV
jgi:hypothetical protein